MKLYFLFGTFLSELSFQQVDICLENQFGVQNTLILRDAVKADKSIHLLLLTVKYWASQRCLNQSSHGTLSTFSWCLLVLYFVTHITQPSLLNPVEITSEGKEILSFYQQNKQKNLAVHVGKGVMYRLSAEKKAASGLGNRYQQNTKSVIELLLEFLQFYATDYSFNSFDYYHEIISLVMETRSSYYFYDNTARKFFPYPEHARLTTVANVLYSQSLSPSASTTVTTAAATGESIVSNANATTTPSSSASSSSRGLRRCAFR